MLVSGHAKASVTKLRKFMKTRAREAGAFPDGHELEGRRRLTILLINENYTSQIPSCQPSDGDQNHPPLPEDDVPVQLQRLRHVDEIWSVKQFPHCRKIWNRDINVCRYLSCVTDFLGIFT